MKHCTTFITSTLPVTSMHPYKKILVATIHMVFAACTILVLYINSFNPHNTLTVEKINKNINK